MGNAKNECLCTEPCPYCAWYRAAQKEIETLEFSGNTPPARNRGAHLENRAPDGKPASNGSLRDGPVDAQVAPRRHSEERGS
jgi:hypothetical protein